MISSPFVEKTYWHWIGEKHWECLFNRKGFLLIGDWPFATGRLFSERQKVAGGCEFQKQPFRRIEGCFESIGVRSRKHKRVIIIITLTYNFDWRRRIKSCLFFIWKNIDGKLFEAVIMNVLWQWTLRGWNII